MRQKHVAPFCLQVEFIWPSCLLSIRLFGIWALLKERAWSTRPNCLSPRADNLQRHFCLDFRMALLQGKNNLFVVGDIWTAFLWTLGPPLQSFCWTGLATRKWFYFHIRVLLYELHTLRLRPDSTAVLPSQWPKPVPKMPTSDRSVSLW